MGDGDDNISDDEYGSEEDMMDSESENDDEENEEEEEELKSWKDNSLLIYHICYINDWFQSDENNLRKQDETRKTTNQIRKK